MIRAGTALATLGGMRSVVLPLCAATVLSLTACGAPEAHTDVAYDGRYGEATTMDVYLPGGPGPHPTIMFIHGGGWRAGSKNYYRGAARRWARSGWVAATINYRLGSRGEYPHNVQDCFCALSFLRSKADDWGVDPERIAVTGYSAGGHLTALVGLGADVDDHQPDCAAGPTHAPAVAIPGDGVYDLRGKDHWVVEDYMGGSEKKHPERYEQASPVTHVNDDAPPFLLLTGTADWIVDAEETRGLDRALGEAGGDVEKLELEGGGHLLNPDTNNADIDVDTVDLTPEAWIVISDFLERKLGDW